MLISPPVVFRRVCMMSAVQLNDGPSLAAHEIDDVPPDRVLPTEPRFCECLAAEPTSQLSFGISLALSQPPRDACLPVDR